MDDCLHIIKKQTLDITFDSEEKAFSLQNEILDIYNERIIPELDMICNEMCDNGTIVKIDKLELNIGEISLGNINNEFVDKVTTAFKKELTQALEDSKQPDDINVQITDVSGSKLALLEHFIYTGTLPWWASRYGDIDLEKIFKELLIESGDEVEDILSRGMNTENFRKRLAYQFSQDIIIPIIEISNPGHGKYIDIITDELLLIISAIKGIDTKEITRPLLMFHVLSYPDINKTEFNKMDFVVFLLKNIAGKLNIHLMEIINMGKPAVEKLNFKGNIFTTSLPGIFNDLQNQIFITGETQKDANATDPKTESKKKTQIEEEYILSETKFTKLQQDLKTNVEVPGKRKIAIEEHYINNAGLVLLWPYLANFFENLKLSERNNFISKEHKYRAVHLLQYLVCGKQNQAEHFLILNKMLCELDLHEPVPLITELTENEIKACDDLLAAVIKNWSVLKNTSINGLRESFLKRNGKLSKESDKWLLRVERKSYDLLLDKLPWGISIVRLQWMKTLIFVEW